MRQRLSRTGDGKLREPTDRSRDVNSGTNGRSDALVARKKIDIDRTEVNALRELVESYGREQVHRWARQGMDVATMGNPPAMRAHRQGRDDSSETPADDHSRDVRSSSEQSVDDSAQSDGGKSQRMPDCCTCTSANVELRVGNTGVSPLPGHVWLAVIRNADCRVCDDDTEQRTFTEEYGLYPREDANLLSRGVWASGEIRSDTDRERVCSITQSVKCNIAHHFLEQLHAQRANPPKYSALLYNCVDWAVDQMRANPGVIAPAVAQAIRHSPSPSLPLQLRPFCD